jgi:hypothetical protein
VAIQFARKNADGTSVGFTVIRGCRWQDRVLVTDQATGEPVDLTGVLDIVMALRKKIGGPIVDTLSMSNARITLADPAGGEFDIDVSSVDTQALPANNFKRTRYFTDALIQRSANEWEPAIAGKVRVDSSITRPLDTP